MYNSLGGVIELCESIPIDWHGLQFIEKIKIRIVWKFIFDVNNCSLFIYQTVGRHTNDLIIYKNEKTSWFTQTWLYLLSILSHISDVTSLLNRSHINNFMHSSWSYITFGLYHGPHLDWFMVIDGGVYNRTISLFYRRSTTFTRHSLKKRLSIEILSFYGSLTSSTHK